MNERRQILIRCVTLSTFRTEIVSEEENSMEKQEDSIELKNLKEENNLLRNIIDRAAKIISDVVQVEKKRS